MSEKITRNSTLIQRNIRVFGRRTSIRIEPLMWDSLKRVAKRENCTIHDLCSLVQDVKPTQASLAGGIRLFLLLYYYEAATEEGHHKASHGDFFTLVTRLQEKSLKAKSAEDNYLPYHYKKTFSLMKRPIYFLIPLSLFFFY